MAEHKFHDKAMDSARSDLVEITGRYGISYTVDSSVASEYLHFEPHRFDRFWLNYLFFAGSFLFFFTQNKLITRYYQAKGKSTKELKVFVNNVVSLFHSITSACLIHYDFKVLQPLMGSGDLINIHSDLTCFLLAYTGGYFAYDAMDLCTTISGKALFELLFHHAIGIFNFAYMLTARQYVAYCGAFLFCETNSIFLHTRQLLLHNNVSKTSLLFRINAILNYLTFMAHRIYVVFGLLWYMTANFWEIERYAQILMVVSVPSLAIIQLPLLFRIVYSDWFKVQKRTTKLNFE